MKYKRVKNPAVLTLVNPGVPPTAKKRKTKRKVGSKASVSFFSGKMLAKKAKPVRKSKKRKAAPAKKASYLDISSAFVASRKPKTRKKATTKKAAPKMATRKKKTATRKKKLTKAELKAVRLKNLAKARKARAAKAKAGTLAKPKRKKAKAKSTTRKAKTMTVEQALAEAKKARLSKSKSKKTAKKKAAKKKLTKTQLRAVRLKNLAKARKAKKAKAVSGGTRKKTTRKKASSGAVRKTYVLSGGRRPKRSKPPKGTKVRKSRPRKKSRFFGALKNPFGRSRRKVWSILKRNPVPQLKVVGQNILGVGVGFFGARTLTSMAEKSTMIPFEYKKYAPIGTHLLLGAAAYVAGNKYSKLSKYQIPVMTGIGLSLAEAVINWLAPVGWADYVAPVELGLGADLSVYEAALSGNGLNQGWIDYLPGDEDLMLNLENVDEMGEYIEEPMGEYIQDSMGEYVEDLGEYIKEPMGEYIQEPMGEYIEEDMGEYIEEDMGEYVEDMGQTNVSALDDFDIEEAVAGLEVEGLSGNWNKGIF